MDIIKRVTVIFFIVISIIFINLFCEKGNLNKVLGATNEVDKIEENESIQIEDV